MIMMMAQEQWIGEAETKQLRNFIESAKSRVSARVVRVVR